MKYSVDNVMLGENKVHDARLNDTNVFPPRYRYPFDMVADLDQKSLFTLDLAEHVKPMPLGLLWSLDPAVSRYDWSGVAIAVDRLGAGYTPQQILDGARNTVTCCTLIGPRDETHFACVSNHVDPHATDQVYFLNRDEQEVMRVVKSRTDSADGRVTLIEFETPLNAIADKVKIYPVVSNWDKNIGRLICNLEQDRKITPRVVYYSIQASTGHATIWMDSTATSSSLKWIPGIDWTGGTLEGGDSGKPGFVIHNAELLVAIGGTVFASSSPTWAGYANEFDIIMQSRRGETIQRVTIEETKLIPRIGNGAVAPGHAHINQVNTWQWYFTSTDGSVGTWDSNYMTPVQQGQVFGSWWIHNPAGNYSPMDWRQFSLTTDAAIADPGNLDLQEKANWAAFTQYASQFSEQYQLFIYIGQPQQIVPLGGETAAEWVIRAKTYIQPLLDIRPRPVIGVDAIWGQQVDGLTDAAPASTWALLGGNSGAVAMLFDRLSRDGYELLHEPWSIDEADSAWVKEYGEVIVNTTRISREGYVPEWSSFSPRRELVPYIERKGRRVCLLNELNASDPQQVKLDLIASVQDDGFDAAVQYTKMP